MNGNSSRPAQTAPVTTATRLHVGQRVAISLIALGLGTLSLALGIAFIEHPAAFLVVPTSTARIKTPPTSATAVTLNWTVPNSTSESEPAVEYDFRYATAPITAENFSQATAVRGLSEPQASGRSESVTVTDLKPSTTYFFAYRTLDTKGTASQLSSIVTATTASKKSACVPVYTCTAWTGCVSGQQVRSCSVTNGCDSHLGQPIIEQTCSSEGDRSTKPVAIRQPIIVAGTGAKTKPVLRILSAKTLGRVQTLSPFPAAQTDGTSVATGDIDGDGNADVLVAGGGADPLIKYYTAEGTYVTEFRPYPISDHAGVDLTVDDLNGDGTDEIITIPTRGAAQLRVFQYQAEKKQFISISQLLVYPLNDDRGFRLASGDLNLDGRAEIVIAPRRNSRSVEVVSFDSDNHLVDVAEVTPFRTTFRSGLVATVADTNGDGQGEVVLTAGPGQVSNVRVITLDGRMQADFPVRASTDHAGVDMTAADVNGDGREDLIVAPNNQGPPRITIWSYSPLTKVFARIASREIFPNTMQAGLRLDAAPRI